MTVISDKTPAPVLVTGGAGFIGSHVVEALLRRGIPVRVLDDLSSGRANNLPAHDPKLELRAGDMRDATVVAAAMRGVRACIHLAARRLPSDGAGDQYDTTLQNILGFINVLEAARAQRVGRVLYASSAEVYGESPDLPYHEDTSPQPITPAGLEKLVAEGYAELYARRCDLETLGLRYFDVYGPREDGHSSQAGTVARYLLRLEARRPITLRGDGLQTRDYLHVEDAATATVAALNSGLTGVLNIGSGEGVDQRQLLALLGQALDVPPVVLHTAAATGDAPASWADVGRLREDLGFTPIHTLRAGLAALATDRAARRRARRAMAMAPPRHLHPIPNLRHGRTLQ